MKHAHHLWLLCILVFLLSGCGPKLPATVQVSGQELDLVKARLARFLDQSCVTAVDSDVRLQYRPLVGSGQDWSATLLAASPDQLRFAVVDPLSRPLLLLVSSGDTFTLVDNRKGVAYRGNIDSGFIRKYLPKGFDLHDLFFWLSGGIRQDGAMRLRSAKKAKQGTAYWYEFGYEFGYELGDKVENCGARTHLLALDSEDGRVVVRHHLLLDKERSVLFEARYSGYHATREECGWPGRVEINTDAADFSVEFKKLYSFSPFESSLFQLSLPPHFIVEEISN